MSDEAAKPTNTRATRLVTIYIVLPRAILFNICHFLSSCAQAAHSLRLEAEDPFPLNDTRRAAFEDEAFEDEIEGIEDGIQSAP